MPVKVGERHKLDAEGQPVQDAAGDPVMEDVMAPPPPELLGDLFNLHAPFVAGESPLVTLYNAAKADPRLAGAADC